MRKFILNILLLVGIAGLGVLMAWFVKSCGKTEEGALSPQDTVRAFYSSLLTGRWDEAAGLCLQNDGMVTYCQTFRDFWEKARKTDSTSLHVASEILQEARMSLAESRQKKNSFTTQFTIETENGDVRTKSVELVREDGVWRVCRITEAE